ncbi:hypothetical protein [Allosphingosinicella deserti]|uniref:Uncharacterized protein n=1 Tax=Allosphingosinicella deserti TaxID=2116704 RepID=A0A2P7QSL8_9SPHN|nr:hypothetical protein [Sphingomonas deserti]PSJ40956.1 hypothetical protein C7I55_11895 [Sphingomonas deserti]
MKTACLAAGALLLVALDPAAHAAPAVPGAKPNDKQMTCEDVAREQAEINTAVAKRAEKKAAGKKLGKGLFGFAKTFAGAAVPSAIGTMGGTSVAGSIAARAASQSAGEAIYNAGRETGSTPAQTGPQPTAEQQTRLDRLAKIGAYRQCPAA